MFLIEYLVGAVKTAVSTLNPLPVAMFGSTEGDAIGSEGSPLVMEARSTQKAAVDSGDAVIPVTNLNGEPVISGYDWTDALIHVAEQDPLSEHHNETKLLDLTNIPTNTTGYGYLDMDGYRYFTLQCLTAGAVPTDILTLTVEATVQDDGTAPASCTYDDVTLDLFGVASVVDSDVTFVCDLPVAYKYVRIKYVTSNDSGNDCDLVVHSKVMY